MTKKQKYIVVIMVLVVILVALFSKYVLSPNLESKFDKERFQILNNLLRKAMNEERKKLPLDIGNDTTLVDIQYKDLKVKYIYLMKNIDTKTTKIFDQQYKKQTSKELCKEFADTIKFDAEYTFSYVDENNNKLVEVAINKANCFI